MSEPAHHRPADPADSKAALLLAAALAVAGALLGFAWSAWSPPGPPAEVLRDGRFAVLSENEAAISSDGRFLVIVVSLGLIAALLTWFLRPANRGATVLVGLVVGTAAAALLSELVGHLTGGGSFSGKGYRFSDGTTREITMHLPLSLHMQGLLLVGPAVVALVYGMFVAFAARDDLNRNDPVRDSMLAAKPVPVAAAASVHAGDHPQYGGGYGNAAGPAQQQDLPSQ